MPPVQLNRWSELTECDQCERKVRNVLIIYGKDFICLHCARKLWKSVGSWIGGRP